MTDTAAAACRPKMGFCSPGRHVHTRCGPWHQLAARLGLADRAAEPAGA